MKTTASATCSHPGCHETARWVFHTRKEASEHHRFRKDWMCIRHSKLSEVLSIETPTITKTMEARRVKELGLFWDGSNGFAHGPGYKAWANDFPEGTRLEVTARIILPNDQKHGRHKVVPTLHA